MHSHFSGENYVTLLKNSAFCELQVLIELIFRLIFQFSIFASRESSKRCLILFYFSASFWSAFIRVAPLKISKRYCNAFKTWTSPRPTLYNHWEKQGSNFSSLVDLNFPLEYDVMRYYFIFHVPSFLIALINYINDYRQPFTTVQEK